MRGRGGDYLGEGRSTRRVSEVLRGYLSKKGFRDGVEGEYL